MFVNRLGHIFSPECFRNLYRNFSPRIWSPSWNPTFVKDGAQNTFVPKHRVVQYGNCTASYTPGSPLVYGNSAPQRPCAPVFEARRPPPHCGGGIPNPLRSNCCPGQLKSNRGRIRAYACTYTCTHGHRPRGAGKGRAAPAAAYLALLPRAAPEMKQGPDAGPGLVPDTGSGTGLNKKSHP